MQNPLASVLPADQADLILIMIISIPLSYLLSLIYNKYLYLALTMTLTIGFQSFLFPEEKWFLWVQQQVVYLLIIFAPRKIVGHVIIVESFVALILLQLRRLYISYGVNTFDVTAIFMMQLFNYIGLGYNYQNGLKKESELSKQQLQRRVVQKPNYLTYLGYVNFLPACLVGPVYEYTDFEDYLHRRKDYKIIPNTIPAATKQLGVFIFALALYGGSSIFPLSRLYQPVFEQYSMSYKMLYIVLTITHIQLKYVTAWSLGMVSMKASGITYNPKANLEKNGVTEYDFGRVQVNNMTNFYLHPNIKVKTQNWNISVQWALRRYIYENLYNPNEVVQEKLRKKRQANAQIITALVSALWHGLYPGYFVSFFHWIIFVQITQDVYRLRNSSEPNIINRFYKKYQRAYNFTENAMSHFAMTYFGVAFHSMTWAKVQKYMIDTLFIPYILLYVTFFLIVKLKVLGKPVSAKKKQENGEKVTKKQQ